MRILLVEDDKRIVSFLTRGLQAEGYLIDVAHDGEEGFNFGLAEYDLIILDLLLPKKSGVDVCRALRQEKVQTPILMLTARDTVEEKVQGLDVGADDYMTKPFAFEELLARISALGRRGVYQDRPEVLNIADLYLSHETREVHRDGKLIPLTAKEFSLLAYLMANQNRALSRSAILDHVWGYQYDTETNTVDVYIGYLRKKVDVGFSVQLIKTIRDVGYKISDQ